MIIDFENLSKKKFALLFWDVMKAEYPLQWQETFGDTPIHSVGRLSISGGKWITSAKKAVDSKGVFSSEVLDTAINLLRKRQNKHQVPWPNEFDKAISGAILIHKWK